MIPNQIFLGLPWKSVRPRYLRVIKKLEKKFPLYFAVIGRNDGQSADDLLVMIKERLLNSSHAIFDATGGNANVSLEFGYAEAKDIPRSIYLSVHKAAGSPSRGPIISDIVGRRRVQYKTEGGLFRELSKFCKEHDFTKRFELVLTRHLGKYKRGKKKRYRTLALKLIHLFDGRENIRRAELVQGLQGEDYDEIEIELIIKKLRNATIISGEVGRYSRVEIT